MSKYTVIAYHYHDCPTCFNSDDELPVLLFFDNLDELEHLNLDSYELKTMYEGEQMIGRFIEHKSFHHVDKIELIEVDKYGDDGDTIRVWERK